MKIVLEHKDISSAIRTSTSEGTELHIVIKVPTADVGRVFFKQFLAQNNLAADEHNQPA